MIIDAHVHLWNKQQGSVNSQPVYALKNGQSMFGGEIRQMMPPYMLDGFNSSEILLSNMDYAGVFGAVITQEEIDGNQDDYLLTVKEKEPNRFKICSLYEENKQYILDGFDGIKLCAGRFKEQDLTKHSEVFELANKNKKFISIDLADGDIQTASLKEMIKTFPDLKIAIGHFGMVTRNAWKEQIKLAQSSNVKIESGGITWLFHDEFYPYPSAVSAICEAADICGYESLMWGSDYPRTMTDITYKMSFDFIVKTSEISAENKRKMLGDNAASFYGFKPIKNIKPIKNMLVD